MKKILISIITILGIGISFCSADGIYHNSDLGLISVVINGETKYTLSDKNEGATCTDVSNSCSYGTYSLFSNISCSDGFYLPNKSYYNGSFFTDFFNYLGVSSVLDKANFVITYLFMPIAGFLNNGNLVDNNYAYYWFGSDSNIFTFYTNRGGYFSVDASISSTSSLVYRCFKSSIVEPLKDSRTVLTGDDLPDLTPKFIVNYGSTSYEYELEDNLSIYLKSPVTQSGNTFTYAGSTGINLYFNGSSQFYNKDKLFLNTPSWFNNNVFTPICL